MSVLNTSSRASKILLVQVRFQKDVIFFFFLCSWELVKFYSLFFFKCRLYKLLKLLEGNIFAITTKPVLFKRIRKMKVEMKSSNNQIIQF